MIGHGQQLAVDGDPAAVVHHWAIPRPWFRFSLTKLINQEQQHMHILTDTNPPESQSESNDDNIEQFFRE